MLEMGLDRISSGAIQWMSVTAGEDVERKWTALTDLEMMAHPKGKILHSSDHRVGSVSAGAIDSYLIASFIL